jgi:MarR family transcriptional regulator, lower aerobic nicotinate degradation pathway regulator
MDFMTARPHRNDGADVPPYVLEEQVGHLLRRAHQRATAIFLAELGEQFDLTPTQYAALVKLHDCGAQSQNQLGRLTAMDPATIQGVIRRLEERHLIERSGDPDDRRRTQLRLSAAGSALVAEAMARGRAVSSATLLPLSSAEQTRFLALLKKISDGSDPEPG